MTTASRATHRIGTDSPIDGDCGVIRLVCDRHAGMAQAQGWIVHAGYDGPWVCVFCELWLKQHPDERLEPVSP